jgi:hypothetical protein
VSRDEVTADTKVAVQPGVETVARGISDCRFGDAAGTVVVELRTTPDRSLFDALRQNAVDVAGVGDAAYTAGGVLVVLAGGKSVAVSVAGAGAAGKERGLAAVIVPRLTEAGRAAP